MKTHSPLLVKMARVCETCPVCVKARREGRGFAFNFVRLIESWFCPWCIAYERVHGVKAHAPLAETKRP